MLPLVAILVMTAIKDGIEDWRRERLDNEVNNSAATKLGDWRNVNQPTDGRTLFEKLFRIGASDRQPSKGVKKLRDKEAKDGKTIVMERRKEEEPEEELVIPPSLGASGRKESFPLEPIMSVSDHDSCRWTTLLIVKRSLALKLQIQLKLWTVKCFSKRLDLVALPSLHQLTASSLERVQGSLIGINLPRVLHTGSEPYGAPSS